MQNIFCLSEFQKDELVNRLLCYVVGKATAKAGRVLL